ncbi:MAG: hypothetical protein ACRD0F_04190, partial [Acidimicrobiales bacterium]
PEYPLAEYQPHQGRFPGPAPPSFETAALPTPAAAQPASVATEALRELGATWCRESEGSSRAVAVGGRALDALATLSGARTVRLAELAPAGALALMAWTAASGGAHGRRRGMAAGRFEAWWCAATLAGLEEGWPPEPALLGAALDHLHWYQWDPDAAAHGDARGWICRLAVEDPRLGRAWALDAGDRARGT